MTEQVQIGGIIYNLIKETSFGLYGRTEITLRRPSGKRTYHAVRYENGSISDGGLMIDQIKIVTTENQSGKRFDQVRIWVSGIPFHADATEHVERIMRRFSEENSIDFMDHRQGK